ncbi:type II secretory pathway component GspD/PulD (secretin) [Flavobacterium sp. 2755]|uniref:FecR family protein n=1 Tax=Flavobacterium sp. 2755 TaxID=2817765 RepID=UPI0028654D46|nr:FecR domain-containing protein [Flavobacterium sp. 2755]MDR6763681.1 type II secretory pathway component GspD/PulD (secretin) [Flavobacterium sp. 2755]
MTMKKSERLIVKFVTNQASQEEIEELTEWLKKEKHQIVFKDFVKTNYAIDAAMYTFDSAQLKKQLSERIESESNVFQKRRFSSYYKYAAILILALGVFYFYRNSNLFHSKENVIIPRQDDIVLQLDNRSMEIDTSEARNVTDKNGNIIGKQEKNRLVYSNTNSSGKLVYNTLKIPYGKRFEVQLSDGTVVHLNAGTSLKYPVQFLKNQSRQVYLTGEAYFEVAKDKAHPFTVNTQEVNVEVLGTKFNVNTYPEDVSTDIVLVEGKVSLYKEKKTTENQVYLTPGLKGSNTRGEQKITIEPVNTDYYTAWVKGSLVFKNASFASIIKNLERHYNVTFINKNKTLGKEIFNARFDNEPIETVLKYFSDSYKIDYMIDEDVIIIK